MVELDNDKFDSGMERLGPATRIDCIVLYLQPVLNPKSYDGARVLEASGRPMLVIGRSYWVVPIQGVGEGKTKLTDETAGNSFAVTEAGAGGDTAAGGTETATKLADETIEKSDRVGETGTTGET